MSNKQIVRKITTNISKRRLQLVDYIMEQEDLEDLPHTEHTEHTERKRNRQKQRVPYLTSLGCIDGGKGRKSDCKKKTKDRTTKDKRQWGTIFAHVLKK